MGEKRLDYKSAGVDYDKLDWFKRVCQEYAGKTRENLAALGFREPEHTRGESAYLIETEDAFWAHVEEGLGTKNIVADRMLALTGESYYHAIGVDTVATIINDLITSGARPLVLAMHAAVGNVSWFDHEARSRDLVAGFAAGCDDSGAVWGGGETPALKGLIADDGIVLAGSAMGRISPKHHRIKGDIQDGDHIVFLPSSGIHTNGLTLCRVIADRLPGGLLTELSDGRSFGEALLDASIIYARFMNICLDQDLVPRYAIHMTGHGWRKLMRADGDFEYHIERSPELMPVFAFLADQLDLKEAYGTFNMGVGFAVVVPPSDSERYVAAAKSAGLEGYVAGTVRAGAKSVTIADQGISFDAASMHLKG